MDLCVIEIGVLVILKIEVLVCEVEFHSNRIKEKSNLNSCTSTKL